MSKIELRPREEGVQLEGLVVAQATAEQMKKAVSVYQELVKALLTEDDYSKISGKDYIRKSGWQKLAVPFNISTEIVEERKEDLGDNNFAYHVKVRAFTRYRSFEKVGSCDTLEKEGATHHIVRTMAETRATSRAIAGLMGVSDQPAEDQEAIPKTKTESRYCLCDMDKIILNEAEKKCNNCNKPLTDNQVKAINRGKQTSS